MRLLQKNRGVRKVYLSKDSKTFILGADKYQYKAHYFGNCSDNIFYKKSFQSLGSLVCRINLRR